ncbi:MAG TPA: anti-sigma factor [Gemmatimonadales bacterium]|nr:anti-sigma factor [Gemmatimonadales bacterium]
MSHVDEGTLHAYLDGELPSTEKAVLEAHLAQCATCRERLVEERALVERASALLGSARPIERAAPPLEQLRRSPPRSPWHVRTPFAWAASIAIALGIGYSLRSPSAHLEPAAAPSQPTAIAHYSDAPVATVATQEEKTAAPAPEQRLRASRRRAESRADELAQTTERAGVDKAGAGAESTVVGVVTIQPPVQLRNAAPAAAAAPRIARDSIVLNEAIVTSGAPARGNLSALRGRAVTTQWQIISRGVARTLLGADPVGLPGLATRRIRRSPAPDATVVVEQALDSSTVVQIFQRPASDAFVMVDGAPLRQLERNRAARESAPAAAPADRLARYVGKLRVEIAGPLSPDSLNRLLEQVEPLP